MNSDEVGILLAQIAGMDLDRLRRLWARRYDRPPPLRSVPIMRMMLAWRVQADAYGGLDPDTRRMLARTGTPQAEGRHLGVGARLTRNWKGRTIEVVVTKDGFRWEGRMFRSLSAVTVAVTGTRWSGPRFFGLRDSI